MIKGLTPIAKNNVFIKKPYRCCQDQAIAALASRGFAILSFSSLNYGNSDQELSGADDADLGQTSKEIAVDGHGVHQLPSLSFFQNGRYLGFNAAINNLVGSRVKGNPCSLTVPAWRATSAAWGAVSHDQVTAIHSAKLFSTTTSGPKGLCMQAGCTMQATHNVKGQSQGVCCEMHQQPGMVDVTCIFCAVPRQQKMVNPTSGPKEKLRFSHKQAGMVNVTDGDVTGGTGNRFCSTHQEHTTVVACCKQCKPVFLGF